MVVLVGVGVTASTLVRGDVVADAVADLGPVAPVVFALAYGALVTLLVPGSVLTLAAGAVFGFALGAVVVWVGAMLGAVAGFLVARRLGRGAVEDLTSGRVARVDAWLGDRGTLAVVALRLVPLVPFSVGNYAAGVTAVPLRSYAVGSAIGILPGSLAYVAVGAGLATEGSATLLVVGLAGVAALTGLGWWLARRSRPAR